MVQVNRMYKEISPNSILVSGGQTTVANLSIIWLVVQWDCRYVGLCCFDEVAGIKFKDNDGVQIMKDYMASGSLLEAKKKECFSIMAL